MNRSRIPEDMDLIECDECGKEFDLSAQDYFFNFCPACMRKAREGRL